VKAIQNDTVRISLGDYTIALEGQFINTRFDYFFTLTCDFNDPK
jgi:hypothetical protein